MCSAGFKRLSKSHSIEGVAKLAKADFCNSLNKGNVMSRLCVMGLCCCVVLSFFMMVHSHEGHHISGMPTSPLNIQAVESPDLLAFWLEWIGRLHLIVLHFPIALIVMTVVAEWLWIWFDNLIFDHAARFMIIAAAVFALPTALFGFALGYGQNYEGLALDLFMWHRYFGIITACLAVLTAILRERYVRRHASSLKMYYLCLFILFLCINITGTFGGGLAFGLDIW